MFAIDFEYADKMLSDFGCIVCCLNTSSDMQEVEVGYDITFNTVKNNHSSKHSITSSTYENVYSTPFEIMKNPCNGDDVYMTPQEARAISKWLNRREYHKFKVYNPNYDMTDICYYGSFNVKQIVLNGMILGLSLTFTANAPYGFGEDVLFEATTSKANETISVFGDGDEIGYIYPNVKITCLSKGELTITNKTTGTIVSLGTCAKNEVICMDGEHKVITTDNSSHQDMLYNDFNYEYLDIEIDDTDGCENICEISLPCEITISYSPIRKVGVI